MASFKNLISTTSAQIASGGTITGDLVINGDLQVDGGGSLSFDEIVQGTQVIDVTNTEALLVRKNNDGGDVFIVDTTNSRIGINSTPSRTFQVDGTASATTATGYFYTNAIHTGVDTQSVVSIRSDNASSTGNVLHVQGDGTGNLLTLSKDGSDKLTVTHEGNVGIGTASPSGILSIFRDDSSTVGTNDVVIENDGSGDASLKFSLTGATDWYAYVDNSDSDKFKIRRSTTDYLSIDESGNVTVSSGSAIQFGDSSYKIIGSTAGNYLRFYTESTQALEINDSQNATFSGTISSNVISITTDGGAVGGDFNGTTVGRGQLHLNRDDTATTKQIQFYKNGSEHSYLETSTSGLNIGGANVGIGTTSPTTKLTVLGSIDDNIIKFGAGSAQNIAFGVTNDRDATRIDFFLATEYGAESWSKRLTVTNQGKVGIGTTSPSTKLEVSSGGADVTTIKASYSSTNYLEFSHNKINAVSSGGDDKILFQTAGTTALTLDSSQNATFAGNVQVKNSGFVFSAGAITIQSGSSTNVVLDAGAGADEFTLSDSALNITVPTTFAGSITSNALLSNTSSTYDIGSSSNLWRDAYLKNGGRVYFGDTGTYVYGSSSLDILSFAVGTNERLKLDVNSRISLSNNDSGTSNTVFGKLAGNALGSGSNYNVAIGEDSLKVADSGESGNISIGYQSMSAVNDAGSDGNVVIGGTAGTGGTAIMTGVVVIGQNAMNSTGGNTQTGTVAIGKEALTSLTSGARNLAIGYQSLEALTEADDNIAIGYQALTASSETQAHRNIAIGSYALETLNLRGSDNIAIGFEALETANHADVDVNIAIGNYVLDDVGSAGVWACVGVGHNALTSVNNAGAVGSTAIGYYSLSALTSGGSNTAVGYQTGNDITIGSNNTILGYQAGATGTHDITGGSNNTLIGYQAKTNNANASNQTVIGASASAIGDNSVSIGNSSVTTVYMGANAVGATSAVIYAAGFNFPDTQVASTDANTLDDYEEGTWTPTYACSSGSFNTLTMDIISATYTKIGRQVTVRADIRTDSVNLTGASGTLQLAGLPFTVDEDAILIVGQAYNWVSNNFPFSGRLLDGTTNILLIQRDTSNGATSSMVPADLTAGVTADQNGLAIAATYFV
jgi:hypothetical protein